MIAAGITATSRIPPRARRAEAGLEEDDIILSLGDVPTASVDDIHRLLLKLPVGVPTTIEVLRGSRRLGRMVIPTDYPQG